jgi:PRTRC genetic system protein A
MFKIFINDGKQPLPDDDIYYVVCKEGVYLKKKIGIMESITPVKNISVLNSIEKTAKINIPPIPKEITIKVINFFKEVYEQFQSEGNVLLFYDQDKKEHIPYIPKQEVSGASVDYDKAVSLEGCQMIGTIHSHANFSAFHSGTDNTDEAHFDGLHITIGNVKDETPSISASIMSNGTRFKIDPLEYMLGIKKVKEIDENIEVPTMTRYYHMVDGKLVEKPGENTKTVHHYDKRFAIEATPEEIASLRNPEWIKNVTKKTYSYNNPIGFNSKYKNSREFSFSRGFNHPYSSYAWDSWARDGGYNGYEDWFGAQVNPPSPIISLNRGETSCDKENSKNTFEINPCKQCCYVDKKLEFIIELLQKEYPEIFEDLINEDENFRMTANGDDIETFCCESCNTLIETDGLVDMICPNCNNDIYMIEVDPSDIPKYLKAGSALIKYPGPVYNLQGIEQIETIDEIDVIDEDKKETKQIEKTEETDQPKKEKVYNTEEELISMASADSGDIKPNRSDAFLDYITNEIKKYKAEKKNDPFPSKFRRTAPHITRPLSPYFTGCLTPVEDEPPKLPTITYLKRDKTGLFNK